MANLVIVWCVFYIDKDEWQQFCVAVTHDVHKKLTYLPSTQ